MSKFDSSRQRYLSLTGKGFLNRKFINEDEIEDLEI